MQILVFIFFLIAICYLLIRIPFIKKSALDNKLLLSLFLIRAGAGIFLGWLANHYSAENDYNTLNREGTTEFLNLIHLPGKFFTDIFYSPYKNSYGGFFDATGSYWNDLRNNIITKILAFINIISRGDYNTNSLILNILPFLGSIALYRVFSDIFTDRKRLLLFTCFLIPTTLFFSSGIHKDLFVYTAICFFCYGIYFISYDRFTIKRILLTIVSFLFILMMRNFVVITLLPALIAMIASIRMKIRPAVVFIALYVSITGLVMFAAAFADADTFPHHPWAIISKRQDEFIKLPEAKTSIHLTKFYPDVKSLVTNFPEAVNHGFLRPYIWEAKQWMGAVASLEWMLCFLLPLVLLVVKRNKIPKSKAFISFGLIFTISMFILIGYITPNTNTILRYKSIYLPLIITPVLCGVSLYKKE